MWLAKMRAAFCKKFGQGVFVGASAMLAFSLTYDELDFTNLISLTRLGTGPHITPQGFVGNGYDSRYTYSTLPDWITDTSAPVTLHASVTPLQGPRNATRDVIVSIANTTAPKLQLAIVPDAKDSTLMQVAARTYDGATKEIKMARRDWRYEFRYPLLSYEGYTARPQGIAFLDAGTVLVTAHYNFLYSWCHKIDIATGEVTGSFLFENSDGTIAAPKIGAISQRPSDGSWWFTDNDSKILYDIDLDASFASGKMVINNTFDASVVGSTAAIMWGEFGGSEYLLIAEYRETTTAYTYVIAGSYVGTNTVFALGDRYKRFISPQKTQGMVMRDGFMYVSSNEPSTATGYTGRIYTVDIAAMIASAFDGAAISSINTYMSASAYPEDLAVHPVTNRIWGPSEGMTDFESHAGFLSVWSSDVDGAPEENNYTVTYQSGLVTAKINNRIFDTLSVTPTISPNSIAIGGPAMASAGQLNGFSIVAVRDVVVRAGPMTSEQYDFAVDGGYEDQSLTVYSVPLTNPGAESGVTGWTNEVGSIDTRDSAPPPHTGLAYFNGGSNAQTTARQRHSIETVTGLSGAEIDAATMWARSGWWQAAWDNESGTATDEDTAGVGVRFLDGSAAQISLTYPGLIRMAPRLTWFERATSVMVPIGARSIDSVYRAVRASGTNNDGRIDDITLVMYKQ